MIVNFKNYQFFSGTVGPTPFIWVKYAPTNLIWQYIGSVRNRVVRFRDTRVSKDNFSGKTININLATLRKELRGFSTPEIVDEIMLGIDRDVLEREEYETIKTEFLGQQIAS